MNVLYPAKITFNKIDNRHLVEFPDFIEATTEGETFEEAIFNASEVLTLSIEGRIEEGLEIKEPSKVNKGYVFIPPAARAQAALLVRWAKKQSTHTTAELARTLNTSWPSISRLEDPHHWPSLRQLERIAAALGQQLVICMEPISKNSL